MSERDSCDVEDCDECARVVVRTYRELRNADYSDRDAFISAVRVLELRHPVVLESYEIRQGSGGAGRWTGGSGGRRRIRFLEPMTASILSNNRRTAPFGMAGGSPGEPGRNWVQRADGRRENLPACASAELGAGHTFVIETPGGGGYGQ